VEILGKGVTELSPALASTAKVLVPLKVFTMIVEFIGMPTVLVYN